MLLKLTCAGVQKREEGPTDRWLWLFDEITTHPQETPPVRLYPTELRLITTDQEAFKVGGQYTLTVLAADAKLPMPLNEADSE